MVTIQWTDSHFFWLFTHSGVWIKWNGMVNWNGPGMVEWNGNKLDTFDRFSPPYRPPLNKDHLLIKTTQIK